LTAEVFHPTITLEVLLAARAVGALSYLQGKMFTEGKLRCRWRRRQRKRRNTKARLRLAWALKSSRSPPMRGPFFFW